MTTKETQEHIQGYFTEFRADGRHIWGKREDGTEVKVTAMVNGGDGLDTEEDAAAVAAKFNRDESIANLLGIALQFDFGATSFTEDRSHRKAA